MTILLTEMQVFTEFLEDFIPFGITNAIFFFIRNEHKRYKIQQE